MESLDGELYGGVSTGPAFHRGALASAGGKAIVCLASRTPAGRPAIRPQLAAEEPVAIATRRRALGRDRVRDGLPVRPLAERARARPDRDRPSRRPRRPARRRGRARARRAAPAAAPRLRLPGRRGARRASSRRPRGPHPADPHRRLPRAPRPLLPDAGGGRADALLPRADGADRRRGAEPLQRRLRARHGVRGGRRAARARTGRGDELLLRRRPRPRRGRLHGRPGLAADRPGEHAPPADGRVRARTPVARLRRRGPDEQSRDAPRLHPGPHETRVTTADGVHDVRMLFASDRPDIAPDMAAEE